MKDRATIVTLCGSTRFWEAFRKANHDETMAGRVVLSVGCDAKSEDITSEQKVQLDRLHFVKIKMSHEILVLNVDGYVGDSTRNEIAYAVLEHKGIRWLEPDRGGETWLSEHSHDIGKRLAKFMRDDLEIIRVAGVLKQGPSSVTIDDLQALQEIQLRGLSANFDLRQWNIGGTGTLRGAFGSGRSLAEAFHHLEHANGPFVPWDSEP